MTNDQLILDLPFLTSTSWDDFFIAPSNEQAVKLIEDWPAWNASTALIVGPEGSGKSHLGHIWAERAGAAVHFAKTLKQKQLDGPVLLEGLDALKDETALFHLMNWSRENSYGLLITSRALSSRLDIKLPDLRSRLNAIPVANIHQPDDSLFLAVMAKQLSDRQLAVPPDVITYAAARMERSFKAVRLFTEMLDRESVRHKRRVTKSLARYVLDLTA